MRIRVCKHSPHDQTLPTQSFHITRHKAMNVYIRTETTSYPKVFEVARLQQLVHVNYNAQQLIFLLQRDRTYSAEAARYCVCTYVHTCVYASSVRMYACTYICTYMCMYACMYALYACMYTCAKNTHVCRHTCTFLHISLRASYKCMASTVHT